MDKSLRPLIYLRYLACEQAYLFIFFWGGDKAFFSAQKNEPARML